MRLLLALLLLVLVSSVATAQGGNDLQSVPGVDHGKMLPMSAGAMNMPADTFIQEILNHTSSGTSAEPNSTPISMLMRANMDDKSEGSPHSCEHDQPQFDRHFGTVRIAGVFRGRRT